MFTLWLMGLGISQRFIWPDQAHIEREHRTLFDWLAGPQSLANLEALHRELDVARHVHNYILPSEAGDRQGRPLMRADPEVLRSLCPYHPAAELALFNLARVDRFLARFTWSYKVSKVGQVCIVNHKYSVGKAYAGRRMDIRLELHDRHFVFCDDQGGQLIKRCPAEGLDAATITGLDVPAIQPDEPFQLSFPSVGVRLSSDFQGYDFNGLYRSFGAYGGRRRQPLTHRPLIFEDKFEIWPLKCKLSSSFRLNLLQKHSVGRFGSWLTARCLGWGFTYSA